MTTPVPDIAAVAGKLTPALTIIMDWYSWLPKGAREKLSLHHLHTLAKRLRGDGAETRLPGLKAGHQRITPTCRENRGTVEAFDEAVARLRATYAEYTTGEGSEEVVWHLALVREEQHLLENGGG